MNIRFPRTRAGWSRLFWLTLRRCPIHHKPLRYNFPWDGPHIMYGFCCEGWSIWTVGFWRLLRLNHHQHTDIKEPHDDPPRG